MKNIVYGVGINDFNGCVLIDGKLIKEYVLWTSMLNRCYSSKFLNKKPTYIKCYVDEYFHSFTNFYNFVHTLKGFNEIDGNGKPFQLDKDMLIKNNTCYSQSCVVFIPSEINNFFVKGNKVRGEYPIGVSYHKRDKKFKSQMTLDGKTKTLGWYNTPLEAFNAYKEAKEKQAKLLAERWKDKIDERAYHALINYTVEITD